MEHPGLAAVPSVAFLRLYRLARRPLILSIAGAWALYGFYEYGMRLRILCSGECNIRVDLIMIYPALAVASVIGLIVTAAALWAHWRL